MARKKKDSLEIAQEKKEAFVLAALDFIHRMLVITVRDLELHHGTDRKITAENYPRYRGIIDMFVVIFNTLAPIQDYLDATNKEYEDLYTLMKEMNDHYEAYTKSQSAG